MSTTYKEIDPKNLQKLHEVEVEILREIDRICKENKIEYFLIGGTLLGAVRHKGFIPWDDDLDIAMTRENYDKFLDVASIKLNNKYYLDNHKTNKESYFSFTKVRKNNTTFNEDFIADLDIHKGIFVDIFPFDNVYKKDSFFTKLRVVTIRTIVEEVYVKKLILTHKQCRHPLFTRLFSVFGGARLFKIQDKLCKKDKNDALYYGSLVGSYAFKKECFLKSELFPLVELEFEGEKYFGFKNHDAFLTSVYGNYMELPPVEKRINHSALNIDFENGKNYKN